MFGTMKKALVAGAVVAVGAFAAPAIASAADWSSTGTFTATGSLSMTVVANGLKTTCSNVTAEVDLVQGNMDGTITSLNLDGCFVDAPGFEGCEVDAAATGLGWNITALTTSSVTISPPSFRNIYSGDDCPLNGVNATVSGSSITGTYTNATNTLSFANATGMSSSTLGAVTISGSVTLPSGVTITP